MACMNCGHTKVMTIDSRPTTLWRMRRKLCPMCRHRWSTYEIPTDMLDGMIELRRHLTAAKEHINQIDQVLATMPINKEICNGSEQAQDGMGQAA